MTDTPATLRAVLSSDFRDMRVHPNAGFDVMGTRHYYSEGCWCNPEIIGMVFDEENGVKYHDLQHHNESRN